MDFMPPVVVRLVGDIKDFQAKMAAAEAQTSAASGNMGKSFNMLGAAAGVAGVAVAGLAAKMLVDGVQAAIEDEKAAAKLAQTMTNLGLAHDTKPVEGMIDAMQRQYGVADDELRPAMDRLLRSTKDVDQATGALKLAMDISAGTGKDLSTVTAALGRAYDGSTTSLSRLGAGIDQAVLKTGNMKLITESLSKTFQGQAQTAANTYEGQIKRLGIGFDELKESLGYGFLGALNNTNDATGDMMTTFKNLEPIMKTFGGEVGKSFIGIGKLAGVLSTVTDKFDDFGFSLDSNNLLMQAITRTAYGYINPLGALGSTAESNTAKVNEGTAAWGRYWAAASGTGYVPMASVPKGGTSDEAKSWFDNYYNVNRSSQEALRRGQQQSGSLYEEFAKGLGLGGGGGGGGGTAAIKEKVKPAGIAIVDGLIEGIELGKAKISDSARSLLDKHVSAINEAVNAKREYMKRISEDFVGMLDFSAAADKAAESGKSIVDEFVAQSERIKDFGRNMQILLNAGLNDTSWNQIYAMGAENGAKIASALVDGNMAENIARTNDAVGSVKDMGLAIGKESADTFMQVGIDNAIYMLKKFMEEILPEGKTRKKLMKAMNELATDLNRESTITIRTVYDGRGSYEASFPELPAGFDFPTVPEGFTLGPLNLGGMGFADGGYVPRTGMAKVHAREFVLSTDMLAGRKSVPPEVAKAVGPQLMPTITVNAQTNADPYSISREIAFAMKVGVM